MLLSHGNKTHQTQSATIERAGTHLREEIFADGSVHITLTKTGDRAKAIAAFEKLKTAVANIKPNPKSGAIAAVRALRDGA